MHRFISRDFPVALTLGLAFTGCALDGEGEPAAEDLQQRLGNREFLDLADTSLVGVAAYDGDGNPLPCLQPEVTGGNAVLRSTDDGLLLVEDLSIELSDVVIEPPVLGAQRVHLTDIRLQLGTQIVVAADWRSAGAHADGVGEADLLLDWALAADDGSIYPLATQRLRDTEFAVDVRMAPDGAITAAVGAAVEGRLGSFVGRIELSDFSMAVEATAPVVAPL